jgi:hypothetical protein
MATTTTSTYDQAGLYPTGTIGGAQPNGNYWVGRDGNVWVAGSEGVNAAGVADNNTNSYWTSRGFTRINDPNPGSRSATSDTSTPAPTGDYGGGGAAAPVFNEAGARNTQLSINQFPGLLRDALAAEEQSYKNAIADFGVQEKTQRGIYDKSTTTNQQNYDANFMDSIRSGVKGLGGLMNLLRGTGAAGGTAEDLVRDEVGGVTARDIRTGADTQKENQTSLDSSLQAFLGELGSKRRLNEDAFENNQRAIRRDSNTQLQELYGKMAGFYGDADRTAEYNSWMDKAGSLTPSIAANSRTKVSPYDSTPVVVKAPEVTAFAGPTQPSVTAPTGGEAGAGIFSMGERRRRDSVVAPPLAPVGA